ncbi:MAG: hypothetical protein M1831_004111 [Alyxoria varia]|nr:MAG: hypothetical protein M1831_004111 [Alyxoria varia]
MSKHSRSPSADDPLRHPSAKRGRQIDEEDAPLSHLETFISDSMPASDKVKPRNILHWFRSKDLRIQDNKALSAASEKAQENKDSALICLYLFSPKDMEWHGTSAARTDFILGTLKGIREELAGKNIPLVCVTAEERSDKASSVLKFAKDNDISHMFANIEYEVDELRRDVKVAKLVAEEKEMTFKPMHDQTVVLPGHLTGADGSKPMKVFTPYHKTWCKYVRDNVDELLTLAPEPKANSDSSKKALSNLFDSEEYAVPSLPESKQYPPCQDPAHIRKLWPPGHTAAQTRLSHFLSKKVKTYALHRSEPAKDCTSRLSPYFSSGSLSAREAVVACAEHNGNSYDFSEEGTGVGAWVREICFREFYRHMLALYPHTSMNLPQNLKFEGVIWEDKCGDKKREEAAEENWHKWVEGKTGYPLVDAGMRQLNSEAYLHNRARMNVASFLRTNLLVDYRRGERYFAETLVDWDLANNTQGWEPSYTVFNPVAQADRLDKEGEYIKHWVPELKGVKTGKAAADPEGRLGPKEVDNMGYVRKCVNFDETKVRAVETYKKGIRAVDL